uniref:Symplekin n=1 Tax=Trichuris muris TaxID=70415 RepID=A0A5S6QR82_TRIMR
MNVAYQQQGVPPTDQQKLEQLCRFLQEALSSADECNRSNQLEQLKAAVLTINDSLFVSFFERVKNLQHNPSIPIRLFVLDFLRIGCVRHPQLLITSAPCILHMARTDSPAVKIMLLLVMSEVYPLCLRFMAKPEHGLLAELDKTFQVLSEVKMALLPLLNSDSEGTRLYAIRFVSKCILITTDASVINSPNVQQCLNGTTLLADGRGLFERLIEMLSSPSTTSSTLIVLLDILLRIVSERSAWIGEFLEKCRVLYENLPPTLSKSQTRSVQKMIRLQLQHFTSSTAGRSHESIITVMLSNLSSADADFSETQPDKSAPRKRVLRPAEHSCDASVNPDPRKRSKREDVPPIGEETASAGLGGSANDEPADITNGLIDYIQERLTPSCIVDLVIAATATWPNQMLPGFMSQYDPKKLLQCTEVNKRVLCRRIAELLKQRNLLPRIGYEAPEREKAPPVDELNSSVAPKAPGSSRRQGLLGVKDRVKDAVVSRQEMLSIIVDCFNRILNANVHTVVGTKVAEHRIAILVSMASSSGLPILKDRLLQYIWNNPKVSLDLATMWAYRAYTDEKGLTVGPALENPALGNERPRKGSYDDCLCEMLGGLLSPENDRISLFCRLLLEIPIVTVRAVDLLRRACFDEALQETCLSAFRDLIMNRPRARRQLFSVLISFATLNNATLSTRTLGLVKEFYVTQYTRGIVRSALLEFLHYLKLPSPPDFLVPETNEQPMAKWEESSIDLCLRLFCHLLKLDGKLILLLPTVYVSAASPVKRQILLRLGPVLNEATIEADTLSTLIDTCPDDAETLVTRIIRQCAARSELSPTVVQKIWNLYESRKPDVRFLLPVYQYLSKQQLESILPAIVRLNPKMMVEQIIKLVKSRNPSTGQPPLTPLDLVLLLHKIEVNGREDAVGVNNALDIVFQERTVFTKEVLLSALQLLIDQKPLPNVLMRTVELAIETYPQLMGFVQTVLQRLVVKEVWKREQMWESFVKCCLRTKPQCLSALLQVPAEQLCSAMKICPEVKALLRHHVSCLSSNQRALINPTAMKLINDEPVEEMNEIVSSPRRQEKTDSANEHMDDAEDCGGGESDTESPDDLPIDVIDESGDVDGE